MNKLRNGVEKVAAPVILAGLIAGAGYHFGRHQGNKVVADTIWEERANCSAILASARDSKDKISDELAKTQSDADSLVVDKHRLENEARELRSMLDSYRGYVGAEIDKCMIERQEIIFELGYVKGSKDSLETILDSCEANLNMCFESLDECEGVEDREFDGEELDSDGAKPDEA